jgi:hypothetical protein
MLRPYAWLGVERNADSLKLTVFDEITGKTTRVPWSGTRIWLRAECDFIRNIANFLYSSDGETFVKVGEPHTMAYGLITFQGVRYSLFSYNTESAAAEGGYADFDSITVTEVPRKPIPYGGTVEFNVRGGTSKLRVGSARLFRITDQKLGRIALRTEGGYVSVDGASAVSIRQGKPGKSESFAWMETFDGDLMLLSLATNRYLRVDPQNGSVVADSPGPRPDGRDGVRLEWHTRKH